MRSLTSYKTFHTRFSGAVWYSESIHTRVTLVGLGGIGSWTALLLVSAGYTVLGYDFDYVSETNIGGQLFAPHQIGTSKVDSVREVIKSLRGDGFYGCCAKYTGTGVQETTDVIISAVDNMQARRDIYKQFRRAWVYASDEKKKKLVFIDGRMQAEAFQVYVVNSEERMDEYEKTLFLDSAVPTDACTYRATSHIGAHIASVITELLNNHITNYVVGEEVRDVPFFTQIDTPFMMVTSETI